MDPKFGWSLGIFSFIFFHIFVPAFPLDRNNSGPEILKVGGWPTVLTGGHVYLLEVFSSGSISPVLGILANVIPIESWLSLTS